MACQYQMLSQFTRYIISQAFVLWVDKADPTQPFALLLDAAAYTSKQHWISPLSLSLTHFLLKSRASSFSIPSLHRYDMMTVYPLKP